MSSSITTVNTHVSSLLFLYFSMVRPSQFVQSIFGQQLWNCDELKDKTTTIAITRAEQIKLKIERRKSGVCVEVLNRWSKGDGGEGN